MTVEARDPAARGGLEAPAPATQPRYRGFDGLRAIAATLIVLHHTGFASGATYTRWFGPYLGRMDIGVPIFFVISGFLLYRPFVRALFEGRPAPATGAFWWRRMLRIYPEYWVALAVQLVLGGIVVGGGVGLLWCLGLVHVYDLGSPGRAITGITQSWSLATELAFYAVLPFWAAWTRRRWRGLAPNPLGTRLVGSLSAWVVISFAFRIAVQHAQPRWAGVAWLWLPSLAELFALGMALAVVSVWATRSEVVRSAVDAVGHRLGWCWLLAGGLFWFVSTQLGLALGLEHASLARELVRQTIYGAVAVLIVAPVALAPLGGGRIRRLLDTRVMTTLGILSYGIYIWHQFFIARVREWFGWTVFDDHFVATLLLAYALTVAVAYASYRVVERPLSRLRLVDAPHPIVGKAEAPEAAEGRRERSARATRSWRLPTFKVGLVVVALLALAVRVGYVVLARRHLGSFGDSYFYDKSANLVADGKGFVSPFSQLVGVTLQAAEHPPLYTLYLAVFSFFHVTSTFGHALASCVLGTATVVVVALIGREVAGARVGLLAGLIVAVYPNAFTYDGQILSESMTLLTVSLAVLCALRFLAAPSGRRAALLGGAVGLAALSRTEQLLLAAVLLVPVVALARGLARRERVRAGAVALVALAAVVAPWCAYNLSRFDRPVLLSSQAEVTLLVANCDGTYYGPLLGYWDKTCVDDFSAQNGIDALRTDESVNAERYRTEAVDYVRSHLRRTPVVVAARLGRTLGVYNPIQQLRLDNYVEGREWWNVVWGYAMFVPLVALAVAGALRLWARRRLQLVAVVAPIVTVLLTVATVYSSTRFRAPAEGVLCVLAAVGVDAAFGFVQRLRAERSAGRDEPATALSLDPALVRS